ncbi:hypothetical protein [Clostridioides difficile]|uniref:hypothetical protein n=1 Tax=Clostridioides difficile TaxID=1496 RepID=UPI0010332C54|nr:hypothetical protein [Clostridioides difficile]
MSKFAEKGMLSGDFLKEIINNKVEIFKMLTKWSDDDYKFYNELLNKAKKISKSKESTTKDVGNALEGLVCFLFNKTYFFEIAKNVRTKTNEIDQVIRLSNNGRQALKTFGISEDILEFPCDMFLGECKNYKDNIGVTWIGKFYGLLKTCDCNFGMIFSLKDLTGNLNKGTDAYGLIRTFSLIEKYKHDNEFYIIPFGLSDFERIGIDSDNSFFDIIRAKKESIRLSSNYDKFIEKFKNDLDDVDKDVANQINKFKQIE